MTTPFPLLLAAAACADWIVTFRPLKVIAKMFDIELEKLQEGLTEIHPFSFRGKLESALATPENRPDLIVHKTHLARLEHQLALLARQFDRAEFGIEDLKRRASGFEPQEMLKAEQFANRIHQQTVRLLKEIQKTQLLLEKLASEPPQEATKLPNKLPANSPAAGNQTQPENSSQEARETELAPSQNQTPLAAEPPTSQRPTEEEFLRCIVRNRDRIRNTPAKDRPALMVRLIEEHRTKTSTRAA
jgi:hypothetical protein